MLFSCLGKETEFVMTSPPALLLSHNITQLSMRDQTSAGQKSERKKRGERVRKLETRFSLLAYFKLNFEKFN